MKITKSGIVMAAAAATLGLSAPTAGAESRVWKSAAGSELEAELSRVDGDRVVLRKSDGKEVNLKITQLSAEDQEYLAGLKAESEKAAAKLEAAIPKALAGNLVKVDGKKVAKVDLAEAGGEAPDYYAIYYSAHWCGPCRAFTPDLVAFYNEHKEKHPNFEIVFVSSDHSEEDMENYMQEAQMPWPALKFDAKKRADEITKFAGSGIPCLVLVTPEGEVLSHSYVDGKYVGPRTVMQALKDKLATPEDA